MKKKTILALACAGAVLLAAGTTVLLHWDRLIHTETTVIDNTTCITHETEKGHTAEFTVSRMVTPIAEDVYEIQVVINGDSEHYTMDNISLQMQLDANADMVIRSAYYGGKSGYYHAPLMAYQGDDLNVRCAFQNGYGHVHMIVCGELDEDFPLHLQYDMNGKGLYSFNEFTDLTLTIPVS